MVDDSDSARAFIVNELSREYECIQAQDGLEGLKLAIAERPEAVVSDLEMPFMTGLDMLRELRRDLRTVAMPVLILTTVTNIAVINDVRALGCSGIALKPIQIDYLKAKLKTLVATRPEPPASTP